MSDRQGRIGCLKWFLTEESFDSIVQTHADFIISCGSSVAGVNFLLSRECRAKNISILRPGLLSFRRFDLVVLPQHDKFSYKLKNRILTTLGAPNLMDHRYLQEQSDLLEKRFPWLREKKNIRLGILLGGNTKDSVIHPAQVETILGQIAGAAQELNADILLTTSRRTPGFVEELLHTKLGGCANLKLSIIANKNNVPEAMGGILGLSDVVVVSGDSISMISEAASSGKPVIVFLPQGKSKPTGKSDKHASFIRNLQAQGYIFHQSGGARRIRCLRDGRRLSSRG